jgi:signal transduction histidine kinase
MGNHLIQTEDKLFMFMKYATTGMAEIDMKGAIINLNLKGEAVLAPVISAHDINNNNFFDILTSVDPELTDKIKLFIDVAGDIATDEPPVFSFTTRTRNNERHFNLLVNKISPDSIIITFDDTADKHSNNKALQQAILDMAVVQGKYDIASNVLHDIGNAVVGFSSYLTRIKHSLEQDNSANLKNLVDFFATQESAISTAIGEAKAGAVVKILAGIAQTQKSNQADISKSITEQQHIITHIQEILNIQRQYISGQESVDKRSTHLSSIIKDCMSMLFASLSKRDITVSQNIPDSLPAIKGDRTKLMQVILNILKNSIEAIDIFAVDKTISINIINHKDLLELQIKDSGKGFDEATGKKLFTRGFTTKSTGTGLGLDHSRAILEGHGSTIDITSEGPGKGALTTIKLKI